MAKSKARHLAEMIKGDGTLKRSKTAPLTVVSSSATAVASNTYYVDTATQTLTLPANPTAGQEVSVVVGNFTDTTVARNGSKIASATSDLVIDVANMGITLCYTNTSRGWVVL